MVAMAHNGPAVAGSMTMFFVVDVECDFPASAPSLDRCVVPEVVLDHSRCTAEVLAVRMTELYHIDHKNRAAQSVVQHCRYRSSPRLPSRSVSS